MHKTQARLCGEQAMYSENGFAKAATQRVPKSPITANIKSAHFRTAAALQRLPEAEQRAVVRIITVGIPAAVIAKIGEYSP